MTLIGVILFSRKYGQDAFCYDLDLEDCGTYATERYYDITHSNSGEYFTQQVRLFFNHVQLKKESNKLLKVPLYCTATGKRVCGIRLQRS